MGDGYVTGIDAGLQALVASSLWNPALAGDAGQEGREPVGQALRHIQDAQSVEELVALLRTYARRSVGADGIAIILRDGDECFYVEEDAIGPLWKGGRFPLETCVSGWAMLHRQTAVIPDILKDPRVPQQAYRRTFVRSMAMAPMAGDEPRGAIGAYWAHAHTPGIAEVHTLEKLADAAGKAFERIPDGHRPASRLKPVPPRWRLPAFDAGKWLFRLLPTRTLPAWQGQALAVSLTLFSALLRLLLSPLLGAGGVYSAFIPAIIISALWGGPTAAATATIFGTLLAAMISISVAGPGLGWILFLFVGSVVALVSCSVRAALDFDHFRLEALEDRDRELAMISRELDHRSKNTLAVVSALTRQAAKASETTSEMRDRLCRYFEAMSAAQTLLVEVGASGLPMGRVVAEALFPFIEEGRIAIDIDPELAAPRNCEVMLSLALNELATNSCKYGALSVAEGEVHLTGRLSGNQASLIWSESGGPRVEPPAHASTGSRLIARALAGAVDGRVELTFLPAGLRCEFAWSLD